MTGGLDARTTMAGLLYAGIKPTLYYGVGNSKLTNTKEGDLKVDEMIQSRYNLKLNLMNYKSDRPLDKEWNALVDKYGFLDHFSTVTPNLKKEFRKIKEPLQLWNFFGELFRNVDIVEHCNRRSISVEQIVTDYYVNEKYMKFMLGEAYSSYKKHIYQKIYDRVKPYLDKDGNLPIEYFTVFDYYRRVNCDTHKMNMCNQFRYSIAPLGDRRFLRLMTTPCTTKDDAQIQLKVIEKVFPDLLEVPFFSHQNWRSFDMETKRMNTMEVKRKKGVVSTIKSLIPAKAKTSKIYGFIATTVFKLKGSLKSGDTQYAREAYPKKEIEEKIVEISKRYEFFRHQLNLDLTNSLPKDVHLVLLLLTMDKLGIRHFSHKAR